MERDTKTDKPEVRALLRDLSRMLLMWSWEGVVGYIKVPATAGNLTSPDRRG